MRALPLFIELSIRPDLNSTLVPQHAKEGLQQRGIDVDNFVPVPIPAPSNLND